MRAVMTNTTRAIPNNAIFIKAITPTLYLLAWDLRTRKAAHRDGSNPLAGGGGIAAWTEAKSLSGSSRVGLAAADGIEELLAIMVQGADEHPPQKAEEAAVALLVVGVVLASGYGVGEGVASPYTRVVHSGSLSPMGQVAESYRLSRDHSLFCYSYSSRLLGF